MWETRVELLLRRARGWRRRIRGWPSRGFGEVDEIADGFERVIDLVGDGGSEAGGGGKLFGLAEDLLGLALGGGVAKDQDDADDFAAAVADGGGAVFDGDVGAVGVLEYGVVGEADD